MELLISRLIYNRNYLLYIWDMTMLTGFKIGPCQIVNWANNKKPDNWPDSKTPDIRLDNKTPDIQYPNRIVFFWPCHN